MTKTVRVSDEAYDRLATKSLETHRTMGGMIDFLLDTDDQVKGWTGEFERSNPTAKDPFARIVPDEPRVESEPDWGA